MQKSDYIMGRTEKEARRLRNQSQRMEDYTRTILTQVGLQAGMSCLDVGCGAGDGMALMGQFVGATGYVAGLDLNAELGNRAVEALRATGLSHYEFIQGDANIVDIVPRNSYDVTFARLFLIHQTDPLHALRNMWQWTKPGGYMIALDFDMQIASTYPEFEPFRELCTMFNRVLEKTGRDPHIGRKLPSYFESVAGSAPDAAQVWTEFVPLSQIKDYVVASYKSLTPAIVKLGIAKEEQVTLYINQIEQVTGSQPYYLGALVVAAYKQKS